MFKRKGGGGAKAFWTMFKKTALFLRLGFPNVQSPSTCDLSKEVDAVRSLELFPPELVGIASEQLWSLVGLKLKMDRVGTVFCLNLLFYKKPTLKG